METGEIDAKLQEYTAAEHRIGANLHDLEDHAVYRLMSTGALQGRSAAALRGVTDADPSLWDLFAMLVSTLDRARSVRGTGSRLGTDDRRALAELLTGPSVLIRRDEVPLGERTLTSDNIHEERTTIAGLIGRMRAVYEPVRDAVSRADATLDGLLPRLNAADRTLASMQADVSKLGIDGSALREITATIERIRDLSLTDPLAIPGDAKASLDTALRRATERVAQARASHDAIAADLVEAGDLLDRCRALIDGAVAERERAHRKVVLIERLPTPPNTNALDGPKGLAATLSPIADQTGPWQSTRRDLDAWLRQAQRFERQLQSVADRIHAPLARRGELRGRLLAFRAKMAGVGRSEEPALSELSDEAHNELFTAPTDLDRAERLLREFGERLATK